jgi:sulfate transport system ATP-binding protein
MDVSDTIVVMDNARIEQVGTPRDLYDHPANQFVMSFVGPVTNVDGSLVRPHDLDILTDPTGSSVEAMIDRVVYLGFEVRVELVRRDGSHVWAQVPRDVAERLELARGQIVYVRPTQKGMVGVPVTGAAPGDTA